MSMIIKGRQLFAVDIAAIRSLIAEHPDDWHRSRFVSRRALSKAGEPISGLVPGNPKMKTTRPTAERLLSQFDNLHLLIEEKEKKISGVMVEGLTSLQKKILSILELPEKIYDISFNHRQKEFDNLK